jgi:hypothetical protein
MKHYFTPQTVSHCHILRHSHMLIASLAVSPPSLPYSTNTICPNTLHSSLFPKQKATFALQTNQTQINIAHLGLHRKMEYHTFLTNSKRKRASRQKTRTNTTCAVPALKDRNNKQIEQ